MLELKNDSITQSLDALRKQAYKHKTLVVETILKCDHEWVAETREYYSSSNRHARLCVCCGLGEESLYGQYVLLNNEYIKPISSQELGSAAQLVIEAADKRTSEEDLKERLRSIVTEKMENKFLSL